LGILDWIVPALFHRTCTRRDLRALMEQEVNEDDEVDVYEDDRE
jgi:hypothetical protein